MSSIKDYLNTSAPSSTGVHSNIDNLILEAELNKFDKTGVMYADRRGQYVGGVDPVVENVALSPLLTLKRLGTVGKEILEKTGLRNPVSHFTRGHSAKNILDSGRIKGSWRSDFPGKPFKGESGGHSSPSVSVTRDPMFLGRPHKHIGTDVRFVMDKDDMIKKGLKMQPFAEEKFGKVLPYLHTQYKRMNPRFEFEERVRGNIPIENIKLIDLIQLPMGMSNKSEDLFKLLDVLNKSNIPIIKSPLARKRLGKMNPNDISNERDFENIMKLLSTPTYPNSPI
jgi:hypothetical protein|tara:strand:+ start:1035 stop:1880 length:846 start_codon:yes stop_codon:yes gene_type:complete